VDFSSLQNALASRRRSQTELRNLRQLLADKSARQLALETTGDLTDQAVIAELGHLQIVTSLLPRRIAAREETDAKAEEALTHAANEFIHEHLGPRVRQLAARTRTIVESELAPHFQDPAALIVAVAQSERVHSIERLSWSPSTHPARGAIEHAEGTLKAWAAIDEFEKTLPPEKI
jgi:hypothetical protein